MQELGERARDAMHEPDAELNAVYELRYRGQSFELPIGGATDADPDELREAFEDEHEERYGYRDSEQELELVTIRVTATAAGVEVDLAGGDDHAEAERATREATLDGEQIELEGAARDPVPGHRGRRPGRGRASRVDAADPAGLESRGRQNRDDPHEQVR